MREMTGGTDGLPDDVIYKDVVVIGNGPSGICMSYYLAGNWPSLHTDPATTQHPDPMLQARLQRLSTSRSLVLQPLEEIAEGLEGRSTNPLPLLMDNLLHPGADMGSDLPSLLKWNFYPDRQIDHIVLGRGKPGGLWHSLDPGVMTLSPAKWMALPGLLDVPGSSSDSRASVPNVANYYEKFVTQGGIQRFFRNNTIVTSVKPVRCVGRFEMSAHSVAWCICGYDTAKNEPFRYVCSRVVLATGASDRPNTLEGKGEHPRGLPGAIRTPLKLTRAIAMLEKNKRDGDQDPLPVLIIGSGLSAADAILRLRSGGFSVIHAHRGASVALRGLPKDLYPEYHQVYKMMRDGTSGRHENYSSMPDHILLEIQKGEEIIQNVGNESNIEDYVSPRTVKLLNTRNNQSVCVDVSLCAVLIGSRPDLNFLADDFENNLVIWDRDNKTLKMDIPLVNGILEKKRTQSESAITKQNDGVYFGDYDTTRLCPMNINNNNLVRREQTFEENLYRDDSNKSSVHPTEACIKCSYNNYTQRMQNSNTKQSFLKMQWNNLKYIMGQGLQMSKPDEDVDSRERRNVTEEHFNGATEGSGENLVLMSSKVLMRGKMVNELDQELKGSGLGLGVHSDKPVDSRNNPIAILRASHAVLNAPKGMYALGPLTGDNFVRFIPGGALAIISDIWAEKKSEENFLNECLG